MGILECYGRTVVGVASFILDLLVGCIILVVDDFVVERIAFFDVAGILCWLLELCNTRRSVAGAVAIFTV